MSFFLLLLLGFLGWCAGGAKIETTRLGRMWLDEVAEKVSR